MLRIVEVNINLFQIFETMFFLDDLILSSGKAFDVAIKFQIQ